MRLLRAIGSELLGLFVDDGTLALATIVWLGACALVLPRLNLPPILPPAILFAGLVVILAESAIRRAGRRR